MKTNFRKFFSVLAIAAMVSTAALMSCSEDEVIPIPDEVEDTIENAYYITGVVSTSSAVLSGVTVTSGSASDTTDSNGVFTLKMSNSSTATVSFVMDGYISIDATAVFASSATAGDVVTLSQMLTERAEPQEVTAGEDATLTFDHSSDSDIVVSIPADAITEDIEITVTPYIPAATEEAAVALAEVAEEGGTATITSSLSAVYLEPSGTTFETPITVSIPSDYVDGAYHAKKVDGEWVKQGDAPYNTETGSYEIEVDGFSEHSIAVDSEVSVSAGTTTTETLKVDVIDNFEEVDAITYTVNYELYSGWVLSDSSSTTLSDYVAGIKGTPAGVTTIAQTLDVAVAGDEQVTVTIVQNVVTTSYTLGSTSVSAKSYEDIAVSFETEQGDMRTDHN